MKKTKPGMQKTNGEPQEEVNVNCLSAWEFRDRRQKTKEEKRNTNA